MLVKICRFLIVAVTVVRDIHCLIQNKQSYNSDNLNPDLKVILQSFNDAVSANSRSAKAYGDEQMYPNATGLEEDKYLNTIELAEKYGYYTEEHKVTTEDGYILTLIRIGSGMSNGPVIFLQHGLWGSSDDFVVSGPKKALAYLLADAGYDVWLGNVRGNTYSRAHTLLSTEGREFWDFTWNEIGYYDIPAMIDYALDRCGQTQVTYIGHGQGTTVFFVMCSLRPEYNEKIRLYISLGTIAWDWHIKSPVLKALVPYREQAYQLTQSIGLYELLPRSPLALFLTSVVCSSSRLALLACKSVLFNLYGYDYSQIDYENLPVQLSHFPSGSSYKQFDHYLQLAESKRFAMYDLGEQGNLRKYKQSTPPDYPVWNVVVPLVIFYADNDWLSVLDDTQILINRIPNFQAIHRVPHYRFNHFDYIWGKDSKQLVYFTVLNITAADISMDAEFDRHRNSASFD